VPAPPGELWVGLTRTSSARLVLMRAGYSSEMRRMKLAMPRITAKRLCGRSRTVRNRTWTASSRTPGSMLMA
jgi:hypothetical protein